MKTVNTVIEINTDDPAQRVRAVETAREVLLTLEEDSRWQLDFVVEGKVQSEQTFFRSSVKDDNVRPAIDAFVCSVVEYNTKHCDTLYVSDEEQAGTQAIVSLVEYSTDYLSNYGKYLNSIDLDHAHNHLEIVQEFLEQYGTVPVAKELSMVLRDGEIFADNFPWVGVDYSNAAHCEFQQALESGSLARANEALERLPGFFTDEKQALSVLDSIGSITAHSNLGDRALLGILRYLLEHNIHWAWAAYPLVWLSQRHGGEARSLVEGLDGYSDKTEDEQIEGIVAGLNVANLRNVFEARTALRSWLRSLTGWSVDTQLLNETQKVLNSLGFDDSVEALNSAIDLLRSIDGFDVTAKEYWTELMPKRLDEAIQSSEVERVRTLIELLSLLRFSDEMRQDALDTGFWTQSEPVVHRIVRVVGESMETIAAEIVEELRVDSERSLQAEVVIKAIST